MNISSEVPRKRSMLTREHKKITTSMGEISQELVNRGLETCHWSDIRVVFVFALMVPDVEHADDRMKPSMRTLHTTIIIINRRFHF